jgi:endonuclease/exonuclease/phosphatase family metal-dependent hydrolase
MRSAPKIQSRWYPDCSGIHGNVYEYMRNILLRWALGFAATVLLINPLAYSAGREIGPDFLSFEELRALATREGQSTEVMDRLRRVLTTAFVFHANTSSNISSSQIAFTNPGTALRVAFWNVERGREWRMMQLALTQPDALRSSAVSLELPDGRWQEARAELEVLRNADIIILNEVDVGMKRTDYVNVAQILASALGMNYAFGVEFAEVDGLYTGDDRIKLDDPKLTQRLTEDLKVDPARYRGLHGNAVLSRFPIRSARIHRILDCYDWFTKELEAIDIIEKARRWSLNKVFAERIQRQVRLGGRMALIVELEAPHMPGGHITAVSTHLEDRSRPQCRRKQMEDLLLALRDIPDAMVLGADLNTTGVDGTPTSIRREIMNRVSDRQFWARMTVHLFSPVKAASVLLWPFNYWKNFRDPTAASIPMVAPNPEREFFKLLREFQFEDGNRFDFRGNDAHSGNGRSRTLANSNERAGKGFQPTFRFPKRYLGLFGETRLDWLLVKQLQSSEASEILRAENPMTLRNFNQLLEDGFSDHTPITVDLRLSNVGERFDMENASN